MKRKTRPKVEIQRELAEIHNLSALVLDYMRNGMETDWKLIRAQRPQWSQCRCEEFYRKVKSYIIRNIIRSGK